MRVYVFQTNREDLLFRSFSEVAENGHIKICEGDYKCVYSCKCSDATGLDEIYMNLNMEDKPMGYRGRSASVSDIFLVSVLEPEKDYQGYYVDAIGFKHINGEDLKVLFDDPKVKEMEKLNDTERNRDHELLNAIICNLCVAEHPVTVIKYLLYIGFSGDDLRRFQFARADIEDAIREMESGYDGDCLSPIFT